MGLRETPLAHFLFQAFDPRKFYVEYGLTATQARGFPAMTVYKFLDGVTSDTTGRTFDIDVEKNPYLLVLISIGTAASVNIQGKLTGMEDADYKTLNADPYTANDLVEVRSCPNMRVVSTGVSGSLKVYGEGFRSHVLT